MERLCIVEDDEAQCGVLCEYIERFASETGLELSVKCYSDGISFLEEYSGEFGAVFMDIAMPHMDGLECAGRLREKDENVVLVFVTSMSQYAIRGYEVGAMDFIVKPVKYGEFAMKLRRVLKYLGKHSRKTVAIQQKDGTRILDVSDVTYLEVYDHELVFHTVSEELRTYGKLSTYEEDERFSDFIKISPSCLANCAYVTATGDGTVTVAGQLLPLSRRRRKECLNKLARIIGGGF